MAKDTKAERNALMKVRIDKMEALKEKGVNPFGQKFVRTHHAQEILDNQEQLIAEQTEVTIAGRLMAKRGQGKAGFANVQDLSGQIQIYSRLDVAGELTMACSEKLISAILSVLKGMFLLRKKAKQPWRFMRLRC